MTLALDRATSALGHPNVRAFLDVIRAGESGHGDDAYTMVNGGGHFTAPPWIHPYTHQSAPPGKAAGAYQFIPHTWDRCATALGLNDFSPANQDVAAVYLIDGRGALDDIIAGNIVLACRHLREEWTSLDTMPLERARRVFLQYGGAYPAAQDQPAPAPAPTPTPREAPMPILALISAFGPLLAQLIPQIATVVSGDRAKQNLDLAGKVFQTITDVTGQPNVQAAIEVIQGDKDALKKATDAIVTNPDIQPSLQLIEIGGGVVAAREADQKQQAAAEPFWRGSAVFWMSVLLLPLVYWLVGSLIVGGTPLPDDAPWWVKSALAMFGGAWNGESRSGGFNLVIGLVLGGICGVYYGVSVTQARQQQAAPTADKT